MRSARVARARFSTLVALILVLSALLLAACPGDRPTEDTPEGALTLFLQAVQLGDRARAFELLIPEVQDELRRRARDASRQAGHTIEPREMLAVERFALRWDIDQREARIDGDRAVVTITGTEDGQRAEVELRQVDGKWRVVLPLSERLEPSAQGEG